MLNEVETLSDKYKRKYDNLVSEIDKLDIHSDFRDYLIAQKDITFDIWLDLERILILNKIDNNN